MSVLEFYLGKSILVFNFPLFYLMFSTEFSTPHPDSRTLFLAGFAQLPTSSLERLDMADIVQTASTADRRMKDFLGILWNFVVISPYGCDGAPLLWLATAPLWPLASDGAPLTGLPHTAPPPNTKLRYAASAKKEHNRPEFSC